MRSRTHHKLEPASNLRSIVRTLVSTGATLVATIGFSHAVAAAQIDLSVVGTFKSPTADQLANLPADLPFSQADLASGIWSFVVRYEDSTADADPDPFVGRYVGAIQGWRLTVGKTSVDFPTDQAGLVVSDGGLGAPDRESIQLEAIAAKPFGVIRVRWAQFNQPRERLDLRGRPGSLTSDALPNPSIMAHLPTSSSFDRFLLLRIDGINGGSHPLLYISSSKVVANAVPAVNK